MNDVSKRPERLALVCFIFALIFSGMTYWLGPIWSKSAVISLCLIPLSAIKAFAIVAWWHAFLVRREQEEVINQEKVRAEYDREDLFHDGNDSLHLAARAHRAFDRYFLTTFTLIVGLKIAASGVYFGLQFNNALALLENKPDYLGVTGIAAFMFFFTLLSGNYFNGISRERGCRFIRPIGAWLILTSFMFLGGTIAALCEHFERSGLDPLLSNLFVGVLVVLGIEMFVGFMIDFFRPRVKGEEERPLFESRLLSLVTEPGGIAKNVSHALDYQFGFKVSETWFYQFVERAVIPAIMVLVVLLYMLDCVVLIDSNERGVREYFGKKSDSDVLTPGIYFKPPWPMSAIRKVNIDEPRVANVGFDEHGKEEDHGAPPGPEEEQYQGDPTGRVILWTTKHSGVEDVFLTPSNSLQDVEEGDNKTQNIGVPASFISANIPVHFKVDPEKVADYMYNYEDPQKIVEAICYREINLYFASANIIDVLGRKHYEAKSQIEARIRKAVRDASPSIGVEIIMVSLEGMHPPVEVAESFERVVQERIKKQTTIYDAEKSAINMLNLAEGNATKLISEAEAYKTKKVTIAGADSLRYGSYLDAFEQAPDVFKLRLQMDVLEEQTQGVRKYIIATDALEIYNINLEKRFDKSLMDLEIEDEN